MNIDETIALLRGLVITIGAGMIAYGIELSWPAIIGSAMVASTVPSYVGRR